MWIARCKATQGVRIGERMELSVRGLSRDVVMLQATPVVVANLRPMSEPAPVRCSGYRLKLQAGCRFALGEDILVNVRGVGKDIVVLAIDAPSKVKLERIVAAAEAEQLETADDAA